MSRLTKTYSDGTHGASDDLPCGENSYDYKNLLIEKLGNYEDLEEQGRFNKEFNDGYNNALDDFLNEISESILWGILVKVMKRDIGASDGADEVIDYLQRLSFLLKRGKEDDRK